MFIQNIKGFITIVLIVILFGVLFFGYKIIVEPRINQKDSLEQFPVEVSESTSDVIKINPQLEIFKDKATLSFKTPYESSASVFYDEGKCSPDSCKKVGDTKKIEHKIELKDLKPNTLYYYKLGIDGALYPEGESFFSFKTLEDSTGSSSEDDLDLSSFKEAIKQQNLDYDLNKDGKVNILDYSLYKKSNQKSQKQ